MKSMEPKKKCREVILMLQRAMKRKVLMQPILLKDVVFINIYERKQVALGYIFK